MEPSFLDTVSTVFGNFDPRGVAESEARRTNDGAAAAKRLKFQGDDVQNGGCMIRDSGGGWIGDGKAGRW